MMTVAETRKPKTETPKPPAKRGRKPSCKTGTEGGPCSLGIGHEGPHRHSERTRIITKDLVFASLDLPEEIAKVTKPARLRDDVQRAADAAVQAKWQTWRAGGSPTGWDNIPKSAKGMNVTDPDKAPAIRALLRRAADHLGCRIKFAAPVRLGADRPGVGHAGQEIIVWAAMDRRTRN